MNYLCCKTIFVKCVYLIFTMSHLILIQFAIRSIFISTFESNYQHWDWNRFFFTAIHIYINTAYVVFCCFHLEIVTREWFLLPFSFSPCFLLSSRYTMRPLILKGYDVKSYRSESKVLYYFFFLFSDDTATSLS